jgi:hypothetical protein
MQPYFKINYLYEATSTVLGDYIVHNFFLEYASVSSSMHQTCINHHAGLTTTGDIGVLPYACHKIKDALKKASRIRLSLVL